LPITHHLRSGDKLLTKTQTQEYTIPVSNLLSLRLYSDTRPHHHHIADLQKGLILVHREKELVGEGTGFGAPIVRYRNKTYFSSSSTVQISRKSNETTVLKQFVLDTISREQFRRVETDTEMTRKIRIRFEELYMSHKHWRLLPLANLSKNIGVQKSFVRTEPKGNVAMTYRIDPPLIHVTADFNLLEKGSVQKIFLLNEQGSKYFRKYSDSKGVVLFDKQIGAWEKVESNWARVSTLNGEAGFRLWNVKDATLARGREFLKGTFDWIGLDYELGPKKTEFEYDIEIVRGLKQK